MNDANNLLKAKVFPSNSKLDAEQDKCLFFDEKIMLCPLPIMQKVIFADRIVVLYDSEDLVNFLSDIENNRNIFCYDLDGNILWQVESPYYIQDGLVKKHYIKHNIVSLFQGPAYFIDPKTNETALLKGSDKKLYVHSTLGYELNITTGGLLNPFYWER